MTATTQPVKAGNGRIYPPVADRFKAKYLEDDNGCWIWIAAKHHKTGYGVFTVDRHQFMAHRWSYEIHVGPIPEGLQLDHLCRVRNCVNPDHLEPVTARENTMRGDTITAAAAARTHCPQGHEYSAENTQFRLQRGGVARKCRTCTTAASARRRQQLKAMPSPRDIWSEGECPKRRGGDL